MATTMRAVHLVRRPEGWPVPEDFALVETDLPDPAHGELLVRNRMISVDPYMRGRMNDVPSYVPPFELDTPLDGAAVGEVLAGGDDEIPAGATVLHQRGWRDHALLSPGEARVVDVAAAPASAYLGALGGTGLTAYVGLTRIAELKEGDRVFVSGAAGAVGSMVGQMAKLLGASTVIGSAGSPEKVAWLRELGFDVALDYKAAPIGRQLREHGPIDVYFDNVGGDHLEAAIGALADFGRIAACGMVAQYNDATPPPGPRNLAMVVTKRLRMQGFIVTDHFDAAREFRHVAGRWLTEGRLRHRETVVDGLDHAVDAFLGMLAGDNLGKMLVRV